MKNEGVFLLFLKCLRGPRTAYFAAFLFLTALVQDSRALTPTYQS